ncbi:MAG: serine/threonine protein kinase [Myxococcales bacterium]|nr:serine/threonine protein kinase [Myxococcales bacterium]
MCAQSTMDSLLGQVFEDRFEIREVIGAGGMGTVFRAHQLGVGRDVALKVLRPPASRDEDHVAGLFFREARAVSALTHPNTITLFDFGRTRDGYLYIAMELLRGRPLSELLDNGPVPLEIIAHIIKQACESLAEAHTHGVVHRDVKPDNIIIIEKPWDKHFIKILDFGIAKVVGHSVENANTGMRFGTPLYMSPEQILGERCDHRTDIYTLGVLLYEALCGTPPFVGKTPIDICLQHLDANVPPLVLWNSPWSYPERLTHLVTTMLAKDPTVRPQTTHAVAATLMEILESERAAGHTTVQPVESVDSDKRPKPVEKMTPAAWKELCATQTIRISEDLEAKITDQIRHRAPKSTGAGGELQVTQLISRPPELILPTIDPQDMITRITPQDPRDDDTTVHPAPSTSPPPTPIAQVAAVEPTDAPPSAGVLAYVTMFVGTTMIILWLLFAGS